MQRCGRSTAPSPSPPTPPTTSTPDVARRRTRLRPDVVDTLPDCAVESFAGVGNPFSLRTIEPGERVVDVGSGAGFD